MTLEEDIPLAEKVAKMPNSPVSSEGEEDGYEESSYGSEFQPPDLTPGLVQVSEDRCRARYRKSRAQPNDPYLVCLNGSSCRGKYGGYPPGLRKTQRAEPGIYQVVFNMNGRLTAAKYGTRVTSANLSHAAKKIRETDRAQARAIEGLTLGDTTGGLSTSSFSLGQAENLVAAPD